MTIGAGGCERSVNDETAFRVALTLMAGVAGDSLVRSVQRPPRVAIVVKCEYVPGLGCVTAFAIDLDLGQRFDNKLCTVWIGMTQLTLPCQRRHPNELCVGFSALSHVASHASGLVVPAD